MGRAAFHHNPDADLDGDGLSNFQEFQKGTDPSKEDTDGDGLKDSVETKTGTFVSATDTGTDPLKVDTDGDTLNDFEEVSGGYDPNDPASAKPASVGGIVTYSGEQSGKIYVSLERSTHRIIRNWHFGILVQDFNGFSVVTTDLGDGSIMFGQAASIQNNKLRLTIDGQGLGFSSFSIPGIPNSSKGWTAEFDYELFDSFGSNDPADGFSLNYGNAPLGDQGSAEEGMAGRPGVTENISFEVDTWRNGDAEQGVNISGLARGGTDVGQLAFRNGVILLDGSSKSGKMTFSWNPEDGASFTTTGLTTNANFSNVSTVDFVASDNHTFNISARVGGANQTLIIDNLIISGLDSDSDSDGIRDQQEIALGLNPNKDDSDNDGVLDGQEITDGTDPKDSESFSIGSKITQTIELDSPGTYSFGEVSAGDGLTLTAYMDVNNNERDSWEPVI